GFGINNGSAATINAKFNWWGSNAPAGVAAEVNGPVDFSPWLNSGTDTQPGTPSFQGDLNQVALSASGAIRIDRNERNGNVELYVNGTLVFAGAPTSLTINGSNANDTLTVDFTGGGNPIPSGG